MTLSNKPIFVVGTQRSGTNLLRKMIGNHADVADIPPCQLISFVYANIDEYGDLGDEDVYDRLISDVCELMEMVGVSWRGSFDPFQVKKIADTRSFFGIYDALHHREACLCGAERWVTKDIAGPSMLEPVASYFDDAVFVCIVRDPRDVALSMIKSRIHPNNVYIPALRWKEDQDLLREFQDDEVALEGSMLVVRYCDLIRKPEEVLRRICEVADLSFEERMMWPEHRFSEEVRHVPEYSNISRPLMKGNYGKWKENLSGRDLETIEAICGDLMDYFGFKTAIDDPWLPRVRELEYRAREWIWRTAIRMLRLRLGKTLGQIRYQERLRSVLQSYHDRIASKTND